MQERDVQTPRLKVHLRQSGAGNTAVLLVHGNCSSGVFFEDLMQALPAAYRAVAPDLRGYGDTEPLPVEGSRGVRDWSDDLHALAQTLSLGRLHLVGWSMGAGVIMQYALDHPADVASLTLISPMSPYGFGGTKGPGGAPLAPDYAGSGGGLVNPDFVKFLAARERGDGDPNTPRNVMNGFYVKPPFRTNPAQEERWLDGVISTRIGTDHYPGDFVTSSHWPGLGPGSHGINNAMSPKYYNTAAFKDLRPQPPVLWVRGDSDLIVSDTSFFDMAYLGQLGYVPGWPGAEACPPQPMVSQMRAVLEAYRANGGHYAEHVLAGAGHSPFLEMPGEFQAIFHAFLAQAAG